MKSTLFLLLLLLSFVPLAAQGFPDKPENEALVHDFAGIFDDREEIRLSKIQERFIKKAAIQFLIVSVNSMHGINPNIYAYRLADHWQLDKLKKTVLVVIKPKYPNEIGQIFIATSFGGLDKLIPDLTVKNIIETIIIPEFKVNKIFKGTKKGIKKVMKELP